MTTDIDTSYYIGVNKMTTAIVLVFHLMNNLMDFCPVRLWWFHVAFLLMKSY